MEIKKSDTDVSALIGGPQAAPTTPTLTTATTTVKKTTARKTAKKNGPTEKRPPGRPRLRPLREPLARQGIVNKPAINDDHVMELVYDNIDAIKRIFALYKAMSVDVIHMCFESTRVVFRTVDHLGKSTIHVIIDASKLNYYYCKKPYNIALNAKHMDKVIRIVDSSYITVTFASHKDTQNKHLNIVYKNDMKVDEYIDIVLIDQPNDDRCEIDDRGYQVRFTLPSSYFKKMVGDLRLFTNTLTLQRAGTGNLTYSYTSTDRAIQSVSVMTCNEAIKFNSDMKEDDIFGASIMLDYIHELSKSVLRTTIDISADSARPMIFKTQHDNGTVTIKVRTETVSKPVM